VKVCCTHRPSQKLAERYPVVEEQRKPTIRRRRIIERPRLIRALDESNARVKPLLAGPRWAKTVLAEQCAARRERTVG
jgi:hypothetical protein